MGRLYLVSCKNRHRFGYTEDFDQRIRTIRNNNAFPVAIVKTWELDQAYSIEQWVHRQISQYQKHGSWYEFPSGRALEMIESLIYQCHQTVLAPTPRFTSVHHQIRYLRALGWSKKNVLWETHHVKPGRSRLYQQAIADWDIAFAEEVTGSP